MSGTSPILTIVTRHMIQREEVFKRLLKGLEPIQNRIQHLVIVDEVGLGWLKASAALHERRDEVKGYYVWILDDDDEFTCPSLPTALTELADGEGPDIILVRNILIHPHWGSIIYPSDKDWSEKKHEEFVIGSMGSSNIIAKRDVYKRYIKFFATVDKREHDWYYIEVLLKNIKNGNLTLHWLDLIAMRQPKSHRGGTENAME